MDKLILICIDSVRPDFLGCQGGVARTPTLDRIASEGVRMAQCIAASSLSVPCFGAINTGLTPLTSGLRSHYHEKLPANVMTLAQRFQAAGYETGCFAYPVAADSVRETNRGFATYHSIRKPFIQDSGFCPGLSHWSAVKDWLLAHREKKSFLFLHTMQMHNPFVCGHDIRTEEDKHRREAEIHKPGVMRDAYRDALETYDRRYLSAFFSELDGMGLLDRTVIAICSDHGDGLFDHGEAMHGSSLYDTLLRTVMILRAPGVVPAGRVVEPPFRSIDLAPTVLDLLGVSTETPEGFRPIDGVSWKPVLSDLQEPPEVTAYSELYDMGLCSVRQHHDGTLWKLVYMTPRSSYRLEAAGGLSGVLWREYLLWRNLFQRRFGDNEPYPIALFNLSDDPGEKRNLLLFSSRRYGKAISALKQSRDALTARAESYERAAPVAFTADEEAVVNERLKDLGYL